MNRYFDPFYVRAVLCNEYQEEGHTESELQSFDLGIVRFISTLDDVNYISPNTIEVEKLRESLLNRDDTISNLNALLDEQKLKFEKLSKMHKSDLKELKRETAYKLLKDQITERDKEICKLKKDVSIWMSRALSNSNATFNI